jgi:hypothetical protein
MLIVGKENSCWGPRKVWRNSNMQTILYMTVPSAETNRILAPEKKSTGAIFLHELVGVLLFGVSQAIKLFVHRTDSYEV